METLQQELDKLMQEGNNTIKPFQVGTKFSWKVLASTSVDEYMKKHHACLAFENIHPKYRAKALGFMDPVYYAIFAKTCHMYMLLLHNPELFKVELYRMVTLDSAKSIDIWKLNYDKIMEYLKTGIVGSTNGGRGLRVGWTFTINKEKHFMNDVTRKKLIELLEEQDFMNRFTK